MVFLSISTTSAQSILLSIDKEEIFHPFCENSFLYTVRCVESSRFVRLFFCFFTACEFLCAAVGKREKK
jgi:hypothetical protein